MVHEHHRHRSVGSPRKSSFSTGLRRNSSASLLSRVLGSFRRKSHEGKGKKTSSAGKGKEDHQRDWIANYKGTHHPDRPRVDKRTQEMMSDEEYAAQIRRMQERSQRHYGLSDDHGRTPQSPVPNFSYSSMSPRSNRISSLTPTYTEPRWLPEEDRPPPKDNAIADFVLSSPVSPSTRTIQIFNASALDRGPIIRYSDESNRRVSPLPEKTSSFATQPSEGRRSSGGSKINRTAVDIDMSQLLNRKPKTSISSPSPTSEFAPGLILNSSPTLAPRTPSTSAANTNSPLSPSPSPPRTCPWRGCHVILTTAREKKDNLCTRCYESLCPRESAFFGPSPPSTVQDTHLETLQALVGATAGTDEEYAYATAGSTTHRQHARFDRRFSVGSFKLLPAPRGKRRQVFEARQRAGSGGSSSDGSDKESGNESDGSIWSTSLSARAAHHHHHLYPPLNLNLNPQTQTQAQDTISPIPPLRRSSSFGHISQPTNPRLLNNEEEADKPPTDNSWTTDTRASSLSSSSSSFNGPVSPYSDPDIHATRDLYPSPLIARVQSTDQTQAQVHVFEPPLPLPLRQQKQQQPQSGIYLPSRDTLLYREIEDIINCYAGTQHIAGTAGREPSKPDVDAIASLFTDDTEALEMKRKGFI
ncbi:hypothetical protein Daesc_006393 [Daldinia eschscholtzii]|uniref:Uncharacterized protein n=1 Tax=Daldinia eschscholtzii TaxID=292717 RepID=A0AAX6MGN5_9PEZI